MKKSRIWELFIIPTGIAIIALMLFFHDFASASDNQPFLGDCIEYGIVCNFLNQTGDIESNMAVGKYQSNGHTIGNTVSVNMANTAGTIKIGELVNDQIQVRGDPKIIIEKSVTKEVLDMIQNVQGYSSLVVSKKDMSPSTDVRDGNNYTIDISDIDKELVYVEADILIDHIMNSRIQNGGLRLKLRKNQTIVLNVSKSWNHLKDSNGNLKIVTIPRYSVEITNGDWTKEKTAQNVIWNMPNVTSLNIQSDGMHSTIIAPKAFVNINVTGEGWLVCDTIMLTNGEWHMISQNIPIIKHTDKPKSTKTPSITKKPIATPKHTIKPTIKPIIKPTIKPTQKITPTPTERHTENPTPTPTQSPTNTPVNTYTEAPTQAPTISPTQIIPSDIYTEVPTYTTIPTIKPTFTDEPTEQPISTLLPAPLSTPTRTQFPLPVITTEVPTISTATCVPTATDRNLVQVSYNPVVPTVGNKTGQKSKTPPPVKIKNMGIPLSKAAQKIKKPSSAKTILDGDVPLSDFAPETGDETNILIPLLILIMSAIAIVVIIIYSHNDKR